MADLVRAGVNEVVDDLISDTHVHDIFQSIHQPVYKFGQKSNPGDAYAFWIANISDEVRRSVPALQTLWQLVDERVTAGKCDIDRMYVNAYNFGDCPTVHVDSDAQGYYTLLYYANVEWNYDWAGDTVFYNEAKDDIVKSVYPRPGRIVFFDSRIPHVARGPTRNCPLVRYTIAIKLREK